MDLTKLDRSGIVDTGLDWLTVTTVKGHQSAQMLATIREFVEAEYPLDSIPDDWKGLGYTGQKVGEIKYGRRNVDEAILIMSGKTSDKFSVRFKVPAERVTRCDVQVTIALDRPDSMLAYKLYTDLMRLTKQQKSGKVYKYISSNSGDTLYAGKRSSDVYLRLYDKSRDSGINQLGSIWRYEIEFKRGRAKSVYKAIESSEMRYSAIARLVWDEFRKRGIDPEFDPSHPIVAIETGTKVSTPDSKLGWLERCVAPVVTQLVNLGYEREVIRCLKLRGIYIKDE